LQTASDHQFPNACQRLVNKRPEKNQKWVLQPGISKEQAELTFSTKHLQCFALNQIPTKPTPVSQQYGTALSMVK